MTTLKTQLLFKIILIFHFLSSTLSAQLPYPTRDPMPNLAVPNEDVILLLYTQPQYLPTGEIELYVERNKRQERLRSFDGLSWVSTGVISGPSTQGYSIVKSSAYFATYHDWDMTVRMWLCYQSFTKSNDGLNFTKISTKRLYSGEDASNLYDNGIYRCYIRPDLATPPKKREIGYMTSTDFINWSPIEKIIVPDSRDLAEEKEFYVMNVAKSGSDYWGLLSVLVTGVSPTLNCELVHSTDGKNFRRLNDRQYFIPRTGRVIELMALPVIVGNEMWVYSMETNISTHGGVNTDTDPYWKVWRYRIRLQDLNLWKGESAPVDLQPPGLISPANYKTNEDIYVTTFDWSDVTNATSYDLEISHDINFSKIVFAQNNISSSELFIQSEKYKVQHYWRVRSRNGNTVSAWSNPFTFAGRWSTTTTARNITTINFNKSSKWKIG